MRAATGYAPEKIQYGIDRYQNETRRLYSVLETALQASKSGFLVGDRVTLADIASWGWVKAGCKFVLSSSFHPYFVSAPVHTLDIPRPSSTNHRQWGFPH